MAAYATGYKVTRLAITGGATAVKAPATPFASRVILRLINDDSVAVAPFFVGHDNTVNATSVQGRPIATGGDTDWLPLPATVDVYVFSEVDQTITIEEFSG